METLIIYYTFTALYLLGNLVEDFKEDRQGWSVWGFTLAILITLVTSMVIAPISIGVEMWHIKKNRQ